MRIAVFDVGGTFIKYSVMENDAMTCIGKVPTPKDTQEHFLETLKEVLATMPNIEGIAFSLPGVLDVERKYIFVGGSLGYNNQCDVKTLEDYFGLPIEIENDARCAAIAELEMGNMQGVKNGLVLTFGTGVGGGIIINGQIYKGSHLISGEASVIFAHSSYGFVPFGEIGSVYNLVEKIAKAKNSNSRDGKEIFEWIKNGDEVSCAIFEEYCDQIILQLHNIQCLLDPQCICIGGGASENPIYIQGLLDAQERFYAKFPIKFPHATLMKCQYNNEANMLGAYIHYKNQNAKA